MLERDSSKKNKLGMIVFVSQENNQLFPLGVNRPSALFLVAGKLILEWFLSTGKKHGIDEIALLANKKDKDRLYDALGKYVSEGEPINSLGPFKIFDYDSKEGIDKELEGYLLDGFASKKSLWLDGNVIFSEGVFEEFLRETIGTDKLALVKGNDEQFEPKGLGFFSSEKLAGNLIGAKSVSDIVMKVRAKIASYFNRIRLSEKSEFWEIKHLWNLLDANQVLINNIEEKVEGTIENGVTIIGKVSIGKGTRIRAGSYLEGPLAIGENCDIGPNCYLRKGVSLGNHVRIGNACELKNTIVLDHTHIAHLSYVGDSIVGSNCNFGAGTITGNLRLDNGTVKTQVGKKLLSTGRRKLGVIMGDNVKTAINVYFMPGVIVGNDSAIGTGVIVNRNLDSNKFILLEQSFLSIDWSTKQKGQKKEKDK